MPQPVYCKKCSGEVRTRDDLVTAVEILPLDPFHDECYAKHAKSKYGPFLSLPVNTIWMTFLSVLFIIIGLVLLFVPPFTEAPILLGLVLFLPALLRLYSYLRYERRLPQD